MEENTPVDEIFRDGVVFSEHLFNEIQQLRLSWEEIDWEQDVAFSDKEQRVFTRIATQMQYGNMAHLVLCGKIIKTEVDETTLDAQKLALLLAGYKLEGIDLWGRYVRKHGAGAEVSDELQRYYRNLFSKDDATSLLLGIGVLAGPMAQTMYRKVQGKGDPLFDQIVERSLTQKEREKDLLLKYLRPAACSSAQPDEALQELAKKYQSIALNIIKTNTEPVQHLGLDKATVLKDATKNINAFYEDIGINTERQ